MNEIRYFKRDRNMQEFIVAETQTVMQKRGCETLDREGVRALLERLHNGVRPNEETLDLFFPQGQMTVSLEEVQNVIFQSVPIPDVSISSNSIFPVEQTQIAPFRAPDFSSVRYDDTDFVQEKSGNLRKAFKSILGMSSHNRYCIVNSNEFSMYEKSSRDNQTKLIPLQDIVSIEKGRDDKNGYSFTLCSNEKDAVFYCSDEQSRDDWVRCVASFCLLHMVSTNSSYSSERLQSLVTIGANVNSSYGRSDSKPVLFYLLKYGHRDDAIWLLSRRAKPSCLLRWEFMVQEKLMSAADLKQLMQSSGIPLTTKSDDGFKFNLLHYLCYFGCVEEVRQLSQTNEFQELAYNTTESGDVALTIALLSPVIDDERKVQLATLLYSISNLATCNNSSQNPVQITILMGRIGLLFRMLSHSNNVRSDRYRNTILHLAIKAGLITVARYILRYVNFGIIDQGDVDEDTVLTLAIKKGEEELACEIVRMHADASRVCKNWNMSNSSRDIVLHQCMKRDMQELSCEICSRFGGFLTKDTEGDLPLHIALNRKLDKVVEYLITGESHSLYINEKNDRDGDTPLHLALKLGYFNHCHLLLQNGAGVSLTNNEGLTPCHILMMVAKNDYQSIAKEHMSAEQIISLMQAMLSKNPDLEILSQPTREGGKETCLHIAIRGGSLTQDLALLCLQYRPELTKLRDSRGNTPLLLAVINQNYKLVCALCDAQSDLNVMNLDGNTPLHIAVEAQNYDIVKILVERGSYLCFWNAEGLCPIHIAVKQQNASILALLCSIAHVNLRTLGGLTPYMICCENGCVTCGSYLLNQGADPFLLNNDRFSCLSLLANAIRQSASHTDYALMAKSVSLFADQFKLDCFGDPNQINGDIETIMECAKLAEGMVEEELPQPVYEPTYEVPDDTEERFNYPADFSPGQNEAYAQEVAQPLYSQEAPQPIQPDLYASAYTQQGYEVQQAAQPQQQPQPEPQPQAVAQAIPQESQGMYEVQPVGTVGTVGAVGAMGTVDGVPGVADVSGMYKVAPATGAGVPDAKEARRAELEGQINQMNEELEGLQVQLSAVEKEEKERMEKIMEDARMQLDTFVMTQAGQLKLNKAVELLINKGKPAQEARDQAYIYFLKKMSQQHEKELTEEIGAKKQQIHDEIARKETQKISLVEELNSLA